MRRIIGLVAALLSVAGCAGAECPPSRGFAVVGLTNAAWPAEAGSTCETTPAAARLELCPPAVVRDTTATSLGGITRDIAGGGELLEAGTTCEPEVLVAGPAGDARAVAVYSGEGLWNVYVRLVTAPDPINDRGAMTCCYAGRMASDVRDL